MKELSSRVLIYQDNRDPKDFQFARWINSKDYFFIHLSSEPLKFAKCFLFR